MLFKSISHISRHASLAKTLLTSTSSGHHSTGQPSFFVSTSQLARQQSQVATRSNASFGSGAGNGSHSAHPSIAGGLSSVSSFSAITPLASLDDEKQREVSAATGSGAAPRGQALPTIRKHSEPQLIRRYSVSRDAAAAAAEVAGEVEEVAEAVRASIEDTKVAEGPEKSEAAAAAAVQSRIVSAAKEAPPPEPRLSPRIVPTSEIPDIEPLDVTKPVTQPRALSDQIYDQHTRGNHAAVTGLFDELRSKGQVPSYITYYHVLQSLAVLSTPPPGALRHDLTALLDVYTDMVLNRVKPETETYVLVITELLKAADYSHRLMETNPVLTGVRARHERMAIPSVLEEVVDDADRANAYVTLAAEVFEAANVVKKREFPLEVLMGLLRAFVVHGRADKVPYLLTVFDNWRYDKHKAMVLLVRAMGQLQNIDAALEYFNTVKSEAKALRDDVYPAVISAYFDCNMAYEAVSFLEGLLTKEAPNAEFADPKALQAALSEMLSGFLKIGEYETALNWVMKMEDDASIPIVGQQSLVAVFSALCQTNPELAVKLFEFMAMREDSSNELFNAARSDLVMLAVRTKDHRLLYKAVKEADLRGGVVDSAAAVAAVQVLVELGDRDLAATFAVTQANRLADKIGRDEKWEPLAEEMLSGVLTALFADGEHGISDKIVDLMQSRIVTRRAFASGTASGVRMLKYLWTERQLNPNTRLSLPVATALLDFHHLWVRTAANSLGGLSIETSLLNELKGNYEVLVHDALASGARVDGDIERVVEALGLSIETFREAEVAAAAAAAITTTLSEATDFATSEQRQQQAVETTDGAVVDIDEIASGQIIGYAQAGSAFLGYEVLMETLKEGRVVSAQSIAYLFDALAASKSRGALKKSYEMCLQRLPHPVESYANWQSWVTIHRKAVSVFAEFDYASAASAYSKLLEMQSSPDVVGYGQLIAHAPASPSHDPDSTQPGLHSHDEASDAVKLFHEAVAMGLKPTTFLYNVLLSKLSKARRLKEAQFYFEEMAATGVPRSGVTFGTMISASCRGSDEEYAKQLFDEMERSDKYVAKIAPFNTMLQYYVHTKRDRYEARDVYRKIRQLNVRPSPHTYKLLIDMYSMIEPVDLRAAERVLHDIVADGNMITNQHYAALIVAKGVCGRDLAAAKDFYRSLVKRRRTKPDRAVFQALLESYVVNGAIADSGEVLKDMVKYDVELNAYMSNILIRGWAPVDLGKSVALFKHNVDAGLVEPSTFDSMVRAFLYHGDELSASEVVKTMIKVAAYPMPVISKVKSLIKSLNAVGSDKVLFSSSFRQDTYNWAQKPIY